MGLSIDKENVISSLGNALVQMHGCGRYTPEDVDELETAAWKALKLLEEQEKEIKALHLLVEWAEECGFGFDQFHDEYERYKDEIKDMKYIDGMIHVAKRTLENHGVFEKRR